jgi:hypothetical protein
MDANCFDGLGVMGVARLVYHFLDMPRTASLFSSDQFISPHHLTLKRNDTRMTNPETNKYKYHNLEKSISMILFPNDKTNYLCVYTTEFSAHPLPLICTIQVF